MIMAVNGANILSLILPISMFLYAILEKPRPHKVSHKKIEISRARDTQ